MGSKAKCLKEKIQARAQLVGAPLLVAQLGALEFREKMLDGDNTILKSLRLGTQSTVGEVIKNLGRASPLAVLQLCFGCQEYDFGENLLQHADDLDFTQDALTAIGESHALNPVLNKVLAGFNRRRRYQRFKCGHHTLELDRLRFATTASTLDSDLLAKDIVKKEPKLARTNRTNQESGTGPCWFFQRQFGCRRDPCPFVHKCTICDKPGHGAFDCHTRRYRDDHEAGPRSNRDGERERPPNPRTRRARARAVDSSESQNSRTNSNNH